MGAAGSSVLVLAIVRDLAEGRALVVLLSRVTLVTTTVPLLAPVAGAELLPLIGWRGIFGVLAIASAAVLLAAAATLPETHPYRSEPVRLRSTLRAVCSDRAFRWATVVASMTFAGGYAYAAASSLLLQVVYGLSPRAYSGVFLWVFVAGCGGCFPWSGAAPRPRSTHFRPSPSRAWCPRSPASSGCATPLRWRWSCSAPPPPPWPPPASWSGPGWRGVARRRSRSVS